MLNIQTAIPKRIDWLVMQVTDIKQLEEFNVLYPNKITQLNSGTWCSVVDGCPIDVTDWLVWDETEVVGVYTDEAFSEHMNLVTA